jgi:hypothetical protein
LEVVSTDKPGDGWSGKYSGVYDIPPLREEAGSEGGLERRS